MKISEFTELMKTFGDSDRHVFQRIEAANEIFREYERLKKIEDEFESLKIANKVFEIQN